ncbi:hypothetical protein PHET_10204 [Paragonimus heterotremus]|uniref:Uncharacterized protein n=1 Tax=Paragonimus heterotremus TaxID=100268 RepID=A0A8J4T998_9TREM|nr:hypothetical protein PHET_10204 [Paragonimus heterotremus]
MSQVSLKMPKTVTNVYIPAHYSVRSNKAIELCILIIALCGLTYNLGQLSGFLTGHFIRGLENQECRICEHSIIKANMWSVHTERQEELDFPLTYSIMVFTDLDRAVRLLKAIHLPHNQYCIHVDRKTLETSENYLRQAAMFLGCNILFVPSEKRLNVKWGTLSVLEAELMCAQLLMQADAKWKYWINLTGHEFPLKTNWEIVSALRAMNGTNVVDAHYHYSGFITVLRIESTPVLLDTISSEALPPKSASHSVMSNLNTVVN